MTPRAHCAQGHFFAFRIRWSHATVSERLISEPRYRSLDLWRAALCLYIVCEHAGVVLWYGSVGTTGWDAPLRQALVAPLLWNVGTGLFFVVSGYCVLASADSCRRRNGNPFGFLFRRYARILPGYWFALLGLTVILAILAHRGHLGWLNHAYGLQLYPLSDMNLPRWLGNITLTETWRPILGGGTSLVLTRVAWSLCHQMQFYTIVAIVLALTPRDLLKNLLLLSLGILAFNFIANDIGFSHRIAGLVHERWLPFALGMLVFVRLNVAIPAQAARLIECGFLVLAAMAAFTSNAPLVFQSLFAASLVLLRPFDDRLAKTPALGPFRMIGRWSYSIYLWHVPFCVLSSLALVSLGATGFWTRVFFVFPALVLGSVLVGAVVYYMIEKPLTLKKPRTVPVQQPADDPSVESASVPHQLDHAWLSVLSLERTPAR
jgi:peptidoglycan/LPS O-acetylase OafA/YrhL